MYGTAPVGAASIIVIVKGGFLFMTDEILEIGTDIKSGWNFKDGDLCLVKQNDNIYQSIQNRLNTNYDSLSLYYGEYGSFVSKFRGWKTLDTTLNFMKTEIINTLNQDPRLQNIDVELEYVGDGEIKGKIHVLFDDDTDLSMSLVLNNLGVAIEEAEDE